MMIDNRLFSLSIWICSVLKLYRFGLKGIQIEAMLNLFGFLSLLWNSKEPNLKSLWNKFVRPISRSQWNLSFIWYGSNVDDNKAHGIWFLKKRDTTQQSSLYWGIAGRSRYDNRSPSKGVIRTMRHCSTNKKHYVAVVLAFCSHCLSDQIIRLLLVEHCRIVWDTPFEGLLSPTLLRSLIALESERNLNGT